MTIKKFVPCIYLYQGHAVKGLNDTSIVETEPLRLVNLYNQSNADELIVFDMSQGDEEHEAALDILKEICAAAEMDVIGAGNVKRMEDIKKLLYAGCRRAVLDYDNEGNIAITEEVSLKFGRDKILASFGGGEALRHREASQGNISSQNSTVTQDDTISQNGAVTQDDTISQNGAVAQDDTISQNSAALQGNTAAQGVELLMAHRKLLEKYVSGLILLTPHRIRETESVISLPFYVQIRELALNKLLEIFAHENVCGVTGNIINENYREILALKGLCRENNIPVECFETAYAWEDFKKNSDGMVPVIVQDYRTSEVLMMAYMNEEAYRQTLVTGRMTYFSRSRNELWLKGETSGHFQYVKSLTADCDMDTILAKVSQVGAACHTGARSCFFNQIIKKEYEVADNPLLVFEEVLNVIRDRKAHPKEGSYTNYLFDKGIDKILKKLGEEATEIVIAAKNPNANEVKYEISDFLYHMMVLMVEKDVSWEEITTELANR